MINIGVLAHSELLYIPDDPDKSMKFAKDYTIDEENKIKEIVHRIYGNYRKEQE